jgi:broad specificity phosphatase PhoE
MQSALVADVLDDAGVSSVYCSSLSRSRQTAEFLGKPVELPGLEELDAGEWDGLSFEEIRQRWPALYAARGYDFSLQPPGAEDRRHGLHRFSAAIRFALEHSEGNIAIVAHASVIQLLFCEMLGRPLESGRTFKVPYGSVTALRYDGGRLFPPDGAQTPHPKLDGALCTSLLDAAGVPPRVSEHCTATASEAMRIADALCDAGVPLNRELIYVAARLHDVARVEKDHAAIGTEWFKTLGYPEIADIIRQHHELDHLDRLDEAAVVFIADKIVCDSGRVPLEERFRRSRGKCRSPEALSVWERRYTAAQTIAKRMNAVCGKTIIA